MTKAGTPNAGLIDRTLQVIAAMNGAQQAAVFRRAGLGLALAASRSVDQALLDAAQGLWTGFRGPLEAGRPASSEAPSLTLLPLVHQGELVGCVALDALDAKLCPPKYRDQVLAIVARAVSRKGDAGPLAAVAETILEEMPARDYAREQLLDLLERNQWSIARVARFLGITRRTLYLRLQRYGIARRSGPAAG
jgi:hypothetical protein